MKNKKPESNMGKEELNQRKKLEDIKADYFLQQLFDMSHKRRALEVIRYNKNIQQRINININDYKENSKIYSSIEIELIPAKKLFGEFINIEKEDEKYYHIYFNNKTEEIKRNTFNKKDKVKKIRIKVDYQVKSFQNLFYNCNIIESIYFKKFLRNNITNMSYMFYNCSKLKELNLSNFNTDNVTNMSYMFSRCSSLKELKLNNLNTNNVIDMNNMFSDCSSLNKLNLVVMLLI